jgi:polyisoprenyl-teichoic acid--peptidoglycan teichoic acid transferase
MRNKILIIIVGVLFLVIFGKIIITAVRLSPVLFQLVFNNKVEIKKSDGNINILLLGIGGGTHDGPNLSDTMIFASINQLKNKVVLISLPRDLWSPDLDNKINVAYADGESKRK